MTAIVVLLVAIVMSNTVLVAVSVGIAIMGLILLRRDWLSEGAEAETEGAAGKDPDRRESAADNPSSVGGLTPELFTPDVSYEEAVRQVDDDEELDLGGGD